MEQGAGWLTRYAGRDQVLSPAARQAEISVAFSPVSLPVQRHSSRFQLMTMMIYHYHYERATESIDNQPSLDDYPDRWLVGLNP